MANQGEERTRLLRLYEETGEEEYLRAARCLRESNPDTSDLFEYLKGRPKKRGPKRKDDDADLLAMGRMLARMRARGEVPSVRRAAWKQVEEDSEHSPASKAKRLQKKYNILRWEIEYHLNIERDFKRRERSLQSLLAAACPAAHFAEAVRSAQRFGSLVRSIERGPAAALRRWDIIRRRN